MDSKGGIVDLVFLLIVVQVYVTIINVVPVRASIINDPDLVRITEVRHHRTTIEYVGDGDDSLPLELGLDGDDLEDLCVGVR
jgi:hypothetical protein